MSSFTLAERAGKLGGSDWQNAFAIPPYGCIKRGVYEKRGVTPDYPPDETEVMERGTRLEPLVAALYMKETGNKVIRRTSFGKQDVPDYWITHVDRVIPGDNDGRGTGVLECKTAMREVFHKITRKGQLHDAWMFQVQHYLACTGYKWADVCVLWPDGWKHKIFPVARDDDMIAKMKAYTDIFWKMVEFGPMPDALPLNSRPCGSCPWRRTCQGEALDSMVAKDADGDGEYVEIADDDELAKLVAQYDEVARVVYDADADKESLKAEIKAELEKRNLPRVRVNGMRVCSSVSKPRVSIDYKAWQAVDAKSYKDVIAKYPRVGKPTTTLRIFPA